MRKIRKYRLYAKYEVDLWGWFLFQRSKGSGKVLAKILYRHRRLSGWMRKRLNEEYEIWKYLKPRKGFGYHRSLFKKQLQEKQKTQYFYGFVKEKQLKQIYNHAKKEKGRLEDLFSGFLESRLLTFAYRLRFFDTMKIGLQYIQHHGLMVDGRRVNKPNYLLSPGEKLEFCLEDLKGIHHLRKVTTKHKTHLLFPFWTFPKKKGRNRFFRFHQTRKKLFRKYGKRITLSWLKKSGRLWYPPNYVEFSPLLMKAMLVYRPVAKEIFHPFRLNLLEVVSYFKYH